MLGNSIEVTYGAYAAHVKKESCLAFANGEVVSNPFNDIGEAVFVENFRTLWKIMDTMD